ncbi:PQQ-dependent sugar dehydrogenase [Dehalogenimonas sp. 4OHTPN]|uniref:PQQ-dependent sugar dehydrogenase n=1 Tax=Dehalogenimonas sp. 4OHTPN TaxID=3166643 RepID=A0AAU8GCE7_9CHLR
MSRPRTIATILIVVVLVAGGFIWWNFLARRAIPPPPDGNSQIASAVVEGLEIPWELAFLSDGAILLTERPGRVRYIDSSGALRADPLPGVEGVAAVGEGGLLGLALHPGFDYNRWIYLYHTYRAGSGLANRVVRYTLGNGLTLSGYTVIIDGIPGGNVHNGGRIKFGPDGLLYIGTGDSGIDTLAQDLNSLAGKILRLNDDGSIPSNNPFPNSAVYSYGHRNVQGLAWDGFGQLWATEHGSNNFDELNLIEAANNYGWPVVRGETTAPGMTGPKLHSGNDTWAPSGLTFFQGSLYFTGLRGQSIFEYNLQTGRLTRYLNGIFGRLRDIVNGPDGYLYVITNNLDGRGIPLAGDDHLIRINPARLAETA